MSFAKSPEPELKRAAGNPLLSRTPRLDAVSAARLARDLYGVDADVTLLPSERDQNFLLTSSAGVRTVLKIANGGDDRAVLEAQNDALEHVARRGVDFCPRVVPTLAGETIASTDGGTHFVRCVTYLPGIPLAQVPGPFGPGDLFFNLGRAVGDLDAALSDFDHPAVHRDFYWDLAKAPRIITDNLPLVSPERHRQVVDHISRSSLSFIEDHLAALPRATVHHDANDWNVLVDGSRISGIIDFGDIVHSWRVADPAVAVAYAMLDADELLSTAAAIVHGYHERHPMHDAEIAVVFPLAALRLCMSACIAASQQRQRAGDAYLGISQAQIERTLPRLAAIPLRDAHERFRRLPR